MFTSSFITDPARMNAGYADLFNAGDKKSLLQLFHPSAKLISDQGREIVGPEAIGQALAYYLNLNATITIENKYTVITGDYALMRSEWIMRWETASGTIQMVLGAGTELVQRQLAGNWLFLIDHPFGATPAL